MLPQGAQLRVIEPLDLTSRQRRKEHRLEYVHAQSAHDIDHAGRQILAPESDMGAHHCDEGTAPRLRLEKVRGRRFGMIGDGVGPTDFELDPQPARGISLLQQHIDAR